MGNELSVIAFIIALAAFIIAVGKRRRLIINNNMVTRDGGGIINDKIIIHQQRFDGDEGVAPQQSKHKDMESEGSLKNRKS